jgi:hypothetical protein
VQEWVRQISHHQQYQHQDASKRMADDEDLELERFALDIAESLVSSMEKSAGIQTKVCLHILFRYIDAHRLKI